MEKFSIFNEPSENQVFHGKPSTLTICDKCENRLPNGVCDMCNHAEMNAAIISGKCEYVIEK